MPRDRERGGSLFPDPVADRRDAPLADRMRPRTLEELSARRRTSAPTSRCGGALEKDQLPSLILWGPPGSGKTTLAHIVHGMSKAHFEAMSAVLSGVKELRELLKQAEERRAREGKRSILFIDEIHRYNKAQQDALLVARRVGDVVPDRRHHREPQLRGQRRAALALARGDAEAARRAAAGRG
jgi:putative ATPase